MSFCRCRRPRPLALIIAFFVSVDRSHFSRRSIAEKDRSSQTDRERPTDRDRRRPTKRPRLIDLRDTKRPKVPPTARRRRRRKKKKRKKKKRERSTSGVTDFAESR